MNLQPILSLPWFGAIWEGALLGVVGAMLFIGVIHFLPILKAESQSRKALTKIRLEANRNKQPEDPRAS